jgi:hypothetical protein
LLHYAGKAFAVAMRLVPRRRRFRAAQLLARAAEPLIRRTEACRLQQRAKIDGAAEIALYFVTDALTVHGTEYDPVLTIDGYDEFVRLCGEGRGMLVVQPHAVLTKLQFRVFHDRGLEPVGVTAEGRMRFAGTKILAEMLGPSPTFLVAARDRLRAGRIVSAMIDRGEPQAGRTVEFETQNGTISVAPALLQVAVRCGARVAFTVVSIERGRVAAKLVPATSETVEGLTSEFAEFVRAHIASRAGVADVAPDANAAQPALLEGARR